MNGATINPLGTSVVFSTTIWFNVSPNRLFNFLRHEKSRNEVCYKLTSHRILLNNISTLSIITFCSVYRLLSMCMLV
jgi:homeobox-leucine zipper protein